MSSVPVRWRAARRRRLAAWGGWRTIPRTLATLAVTAAAAIGQVTVDQVMDDFGLSNDAARILNGEMVQSSLTESSDREIAVGLTFLVQQPTAKVLDGFRSAVDMKADPHLRTSVAINGSPEDFVSLGVPADEAKRYVEARPGDALNLSADEITAFDALASAGGDPTSNVERQLRSMLYDRYRAYRTNGLDGIVPYARRNEARKPSEELRAAAKAASLLDRYYSPALWQLLQSYPRGKPPELEERFYWLRYDLDARPNYALRHRMALPFNGGVVLVDRDYYVSHGYNTSQAISGLVPVPEGTVVFYRNRVSTDQVGGFGSSMKRKIGRSVMAKQLTDIFERSRASYVRDEMSPAPVQDPKLLR